MLRWTRLSCRVFQANAVRLQLFALAYHLAKFLRSLASGRGGAMDAHDPAREADQDRRQHRAPRPLRRVPAGRGGRAAGAVRHDPAPDRPAAGAARAGDLKRRSGAAAEAKGRAMRRRMASGTGAAQIRPWSRVRRPPPPGIRSRTGVRLDRAPSWAHAVPCRPRPYGKSQFTAY